MELWIARDDIDDTLWIYDIKPFKCGANFAYENGTKMMFQIPKELFPEVTFENSPQQIELKLKEK